MQGDILKYVVELDPSHSNEESENYYIQAIDIDSTQGTPFNQAGTLFKSEDPIKSLIYFYLSTLSAEALNIAESNAASLLNKYREDFFQHVKGNELIR